MYAGINVLTKLMYFQQILYLLGVNKYYGYGYGYGYYILYINMVNSKLPKVEYVAYIVSCCIDHSSVLYTVHTFSSLNVLF